MPAGVILLGPPGGADSAIQASLPAPARPQLPEFGEQNLCLLQILGVEALGEPVINWGEQLIRLLAPTLALPQAGEAGRGAQFPHFRLLAASPVERGEKVPLGTLKVAL